MTITIGMIVASVIVGILSMVIGLIWYSMQVFGKPWMNDNGFKEEDLGNGPGLGYLYSLLAAVITGFVFSFLVNYFSIETLVGVLGFGFASWVGFIATTYASNYVFTRKTFRLFLIDTGYYLVFVLISSFVVHFIR